MGRASPAPSDGSRPPVEMRQTGVQASGLCAADLRLKRGGDQVRPSHRVHGPPLAVQRTPKRLDHQRTAIWVALCMGGVADPSPQPGEFDGSGSDKVAPVAPVAPVAGVLSEMAAGRPATRPAGDYGAPMTRIGSPSRKASTSSPPPPTPAPPARRRRGGSAG